MILADTSVWIDYFNGVINSKTDLLDETLEKGKVIIGDLIMLEILQGIRSDQEYQKVKKMLGVLEQHTLLGLDKVELCSDNYRKLRKKGITIRKTADVIIASYCIKNEIPLLFSDRDFNPFVDHLGLIDAENM